jgi:TRAP-type mannitol/chloroaromatic compound transport system substrate-binding protein
MDRRDFLKVGGAAAVAAGASSTAAQAAPVILPDAIELRLATPGLPEVPGFGPDRLARRIETATGGRYRIVMDSDTAKADLVFGEVNRQFGLHPAFAYFAGLPLTQGLSPATRQTWLAVGGGQMLWDDLAGQFGFKPLVAGHSGASTGMWASRRLDRVVDFAGLRLHVSGLAAEVVRQFGATPVSVEGVDVRGALAEGRIDAVEWLGPLALVAPDLQPLAERLYHPGLNANGTVLSLDVSKVVWNRMGAADQAILEACAAEAYGVSLAEAEAHGLIASQTATSAKWPVRQAMTTEVSKALDVAAGDVVAGIAERDPDARRIYDSYSAFRAMLGEARTV